MNSLKSLTVGNCACVFVPHTHTHGRLPLNKDASLNGVDDAAEARLLFVAPQHQAHLAGEGGGQPVPHLRGHRLRLDVAELILSVHQTSADKGGGEG